MFCEKCGSKTKQGHQFCTECGHPSEEVVFVQKNEPAKENSNERWWHRLLRVLYIFSYLPLIGFIILAWNENLPHCYTYTCYGSYGEAFWYSLLTLVIGVVVLRITKIAVIYISKGQKPQWSKEFKKIY